MVWPLTDKEGLGCLVTEQRQRLRQRQRQQTLFGTVVTCLSKFFRNQRQLQPVQSFLTLKNTSGPFTVDREHREGSLRSGGRGKSGCLQPAPQTPPTSTRLAPTARSSFQLPLIGQDGARLPESCPVCLLFLI